MKNILYILFFVCFGSFAFPPSTHGILKYISQCDADAQKFIDSAGITDATQKSALCQLVSDLKTYSIWSKLKAIYPLVGGTATTHKWNLKNPTNTDAAYRCTFYNSWTHNANGATAGSSAYADTHLPMNTMGQNSASMFCWIKSWGAASYGWPMVVEGTNMSGIAVWGAAMYGCLNSTLTYYNKYIYLQNNKLFGISRTASGSYDFYINGSSDHTFNDASATPSSNNILWGGRPASGGYTTADFTFLSFGDGLSATDVSNLYTAVSTFENTLGR